MDMYDGFDGHPPPICLPACQFGGLLVSMIKRFDEEEEDLKERKTD